MGLLQPKLKSQVHTWAPGWCPRYLGSPVEGGDVLLTRELQNRGVLAGLLMVEKVKMSFPTERPQHLKGKTPHCSSCCFPRRVRCNSGQHTQVQLCFQFGNAFSDPVEPFSKQAAYQINSPLNILSPRSGAIISINNEVFPHKEKTFRISFHLAKYTFFLFVFPPPRKNYPWLETNSNLRSRPFQFPLKLC